MKKSLGASSTEPLLTLTEIENGMIKTVKEMKGIIMDYINLALGSRASGRGPPP